MLAHKLLASLLIVYFFALSPACSPPGPEESASQVKVVGGQVAKAPDYMAGLIEESGTEAYCGGAFIAPDIVVTAAHCVENPSRKLRVSHGLTSNRAHVNAPLIPVDAVWIHPDYDSRSLQQDLAILHLAPLGPASRPAGMTPISLNREPKFPESDPDLQVTVTGWGNISSYGKLYDDRLREAKLPLIPVDHCSQAPGYDDINDTQICAGYLGVGGIDACNGDSGGPLVAPSPDGSVRLVGVVSWGSGCAQPDLPGVYTRISAFQTWIDDTVSRVRRDLSTVKTEDIEPLAKSYCYDGWSHRTVWEEEGHRAYVDINYTLKGPFVEARPDASREAPAPSHLLPISATCNIPLTKGGFLRTTVVTEPPEAPARETTVVATTPPSDGRTWQATAEQKTRLTFNCPRQGLEVKQLDPVKAKGTVIFQDRELEVMGTMDQDAPSSMDILAHCTVDGQEAKLGRRTKLSGPAELILSVSMPQAPKGTAPLTGVYRLAEGQPTPKVELLFQAHNQHRGVLTISNVGDEDIHTWQLTCSHRMTLVDQYGTSYQARARKGLWRHLFTRPSHTLGTVLSGEKIFLTYESRRPISREDPPQCTINRQTVSLTVKAP